MKEKKQFIRMLFPTIFKNTPPTHTHTGTNLEREQQLEFL